MAGIKAFCRMLYKWRWPWIDAFHTYLLERIVDVIEYLEKTFPEFFVSTITSGKWEDAIEPIVRHKMETDYHPTMTPEEYGAYLRKKYRAESDARK